jgi:hypothetical protein
MTLSTPEKAAAMTHEHGPLLPIVLRHLGTLHVFWNMFISLFSNAITNRFSQSTAISAFSVNTNTEIHCHDPPG